MELVLSIGNFSQNGFLIPAASVSLAGCFHGLHATSKRDKYSCLKLDRRLLGHFFEQLDEIGTTEYILSKMYNFLNQGLTS